MAFETTYYDEILKTYAQRRMMRVRERDERLQEVYGKDAQIESLDIKIQQTGANSMMQILENPKAAKEISNQMQKEISAMQTERKKRVLAAGFPEDYTEMRYDCTVCEDSGYVDGKVCDCLRIRAARRAKISSDIAPILEKQNFENFNLELFSEQNREIVKENLDIAKDFVDNFGKHNSNLLLYGSAGCGKTFLSSCIANALMDKNVDVVYKSAGKLFADYLDYIFNRGDLVRIKNEMEHILQAQLLIIDDLGTEAVNQHTISYLFQIINERSIKNLSTIISTNHSPKEISGIYTERISSRIFEQYDVVEFPREDLRLKNRMK